MAQTDEILRVIREKGDMRERYDRIHGYADKCPDHTKRLIRGLAPLFEEVIEQFELSESANPKKIDIASGQIEVQKRGILIDIGKAPENARLAYLAVGAFVSRADARSALLKVYKH